MVAGHVGLLAHEGEEQGNDHGEDHGGPHRARQAAESADGHAGKGGVAQGVGEEGHAALDDHGGEQAEEGRDDQDGQERVFHKKHRVRRGPLEGQPGQEPVPECHCAAPPSPLGCKPRSR